MMRFSMDTDQVRMMASALRQNADSLEAHMAGIRASVQAANWQSQAREEYVNNLETLIRVNAKSIQAMRLMARAAERKADQWEAIANKFNGPFYHLEGIWNSFLDHLNNTWQGLLGALSRIKLPKFAIVTSGAAAIAGSVMRNLPTTDFRVPESWKTSVNLAGDVLGTQTSNIPATYDPNLTEENLSKMGIYALQDEINGMTLRLDEINQRIPQVNDRIAELDQMIAEWEEKLKNAEEEQGKLGNILFLQGNKYKAVAESYRQQIETLKELKKRHLEELNALNSEAESINSKINTANEIISNRLAVYDGKNAAKGTTKGWSAQVEAPLQNDSAHRDSKYYDAVIDQFAVESNDRYKKDANGNTFCNIFAGDVARAMGVPFPKKNEYSSQNSEATIGFYDYPSKSDLWGYFSGGDAGKDGWSALGSGSDLSNLDLSTLESHVNSGKMAVAITYYPSKNNDGTWDGHISVIRPDQTITSYESIALASAGWTNSNNTTISGQFSTPTSKGYPPQIYIID